MGITGGQALGAGMSGIGMIVQGERARKQHERQIQLMGIQNQNQRNLNKQGQELQLDTWNKTNAAAQRKHYEDAGLNVGMMYGGSGAGGATTGSQGGGSAASGQAAAPMDIGNAMQAGLMAAQIDNIKADTNLKEKDAGKSESITDMNVEQLNVMAEDIALKIQQAKTEEQKRKLMEKQAEVQAALKLKTDADTSLTGQKEKTEIEETGKRQAEKGSAQIQEEIDADTVQDKKAIIQMEAKLQGLRGEKTEQEIRNMAENELVIKLKQAEQRAGISLTKEKKDAIWHQVWQGWLGAGFKGLGEIINSINVFKPKRKKVTMHKDKDGKIEYNQTHTKEW